jgi:hypothetical protein
MGYTKINNETKRQKGIRKKQQNQKYKLGFKKEKQKKLKDNLNFFLAKPKGPKRQKKTRKEK